VLSFDTAGPYVQVVRPLEILKVRLAKVDAAILSAHQQVELEDRKEQRVRGAFEAPAAKLPQCVVTIAEKLDTLDGPVWSQLGMGVRLHYKNTTVLATAAHVLLNKDPATIRLVREVAGESLAMNIALNSRVLFYSPPADLDVVLLEINATVWSRLGVTAAKVARLKPEPRVTVRVYGPADNKAGYTYSVGLSEALTPGILQHACTTRPGHSGSPMFMGDQVMAIHTGAAHVANRNLATSLGFLYRLLNRKESQHYEDYWTEDESLDREELDEEQARENVAEMQREREYAYIARIEEQERVARILAIDRKFKQQVEEYYQKVKEDENSWAAQMEEEDRYLEQLRAEEEKVRGKRKGKRRQDVDEDDEYFDEPEFDPYKESRITAIVGDRKVTFETPMDIVLEGKGQQQTAGQLAGRLTRMFTHEVGNNNTDEASVVYTPSPGPPLQPVLLVPSCSTSGGSVLTHDQAPPQVDPAPPVVNTTITESKLNAFVVGNPLPTPPGGAVPEVTAATLAVAQGMAERLDQLEVEKKREKAVIDELTKLVVELSAKMSFFADMSKLEIAKSVSDVKLDKGKEKESTGQPIDVPPKEVEKPKRKRTKKKKSDPEIAQVFPKSPIQAGQSKPVQEMKKEKEKEKRTSKASSSSSGNTRGKLVRSFNLTECDSNQLAALVARVQKEQAARLKRKSQKEPKSTVPSSESGPGPSEEPKPNTTA